MTDLRAEIRAAICEWEGCTAHEKAVERIMKVILQPDFVTALVEVVDNA